MMRVLHYIPSTDRTSGGVGSYMALLAKELGQMVELHVATHRSANMLPMEHSEVHCIATWTHPRLMRRKWLRLLEEVRPAINFYFRRKHYGLCNATAYFVYMYVLNLLPDWGVEKIWGDTYKG